jgi:type IV pilus assembly protein PilY1
MNAGNVLWELDSTQQPELGNVLAAIEVGLMKNGKWAAVFGNGYASESGKAQLFVVDLQTGAVIRTIDTGVAGDNGLGGVRLIRDGNQVIVGAYAGDLKGNVWKFDLSSTNASAWKVGLGGAALYAAKDSKGAAQPIAAAPALVAHPRGGNMVLVGTGKLFEEGDQASVATQALYGLWDKQSLVQVTGGTWQWTTEGAITSPTTVKAHSIKTATIAGANGETYYTTLTPAKLNWDTDRGWTLPLTIMISQRNSVAPKLLLGMALFETIAPLNGTTAGDACNGSEAQGFNLLLDPISGAMSAKPVTDVNGDGIVDQQDPPVAGWATGEWNGSSTWLSEATPTVPKDCTTAPAACLCPAGTKQMRGIGADAASMPVCFSVPPPTRWWWRQLMVQ